MSRLGFCFQQFTQPLEETQGLGPLTLRGGEFGLFLVRMEVPSEDGLLPDSDSSGNVGNMPKNNNNNNNNKNWSAFVILESS